MTRALDAFLSQFHWYRQRVGGDWEQVFEADWGGFGNGHWVWQRTERRRSGR